MYQEAADIRDVYLYKKFAVQVGSWYTGGGGGTMFYRQKTKGVFSLHCFVKFAENKDIVLYWLKTHKIRYSQWKITSKSSTFW